MYEQNCAIGSSVTSVMVRQALANNTPANDVVKYIEQCLKDKVDRAIDKKAKELEYSEKGIEMREILASINDKLEDSTHRLERKKEEILREARREYEQEKAAILTEFYTKTIPDEARHAITVGSDGVTIRYSLWAEAYLSDTVEKWKAEQREHFDTLIIESMKKKEKD